MKIYEVMTRDLKKLSPDMSALDGMRELDATKISIKLDKPSPAHTDGELFPEWIQNFEYETLPQRLKMLA